MDHGALKGLYAARRRRNAIMMVLAVGATLLGLGWLVAILGELVYQGFSGLSLAVFTEMTPPPGSDGRAAQSDRRQPHPHRPGGGDRHADRHAGRHLHGGIRPPRPAEHGRALHQRHPLERAVDRGRPVHLRGHGRPDGAFLGPGGRGRARGHRHPGRGAHHRRHADAGAGPAARGRGIDRHAAGDHHHPGVLPRRQGRDRSPACCSPSPASAARPRRCSSPR